jgi:hypothetical protein
LTQLAQYLLYPMNMNMESKQILTPSIFMHVYAFVRGHRKWVQRTKDLLTMRPLWHILIGLVVVMLHETLFTANKWAQEVDMNHVLNIGSIQVIREMEGNKKGYKGMVWSLGTVKDVHRAVERKLKTLISFKLIDERHQDVWVDGVELDVKQLLINSIKHYGLEDKSQVTGCEISITVDGTKLDDYCCHITCGFKMADLDA